MLRCSVIGVIVGFIPGLGGSVVDWISYGHIIQTTKDRERFGKDVLLLGNIDKRVLRDGATKADIEQEVMSKVPQLVRGGGYSPFVDHAVPPDVPFENFQYYMDLIHETCTLT